MADGQTAASADWLAFLADVIRSGSVLGADWSCSPDDVAGILGTDFAENIGQQAMWRDYGLVEFFWHKHDIASSGNPVLQQSGADQIRHLLKLSVAERVAWMQRRSPLAGNANWWLHLFAQADARIHAQPANRRSRVLLRLWLLDHAGEHGVFNECEIAERRAMFVTGLYGAGLANGLESVLPAADDLAQACLDAMPVTLAWVHQCGDWRQLSHEEMFQLRQAKNLTNSAQWHLSHVANPALADRIREWIAVKPRLV